MSQAQPQPRDRVRENAGKILKGFALLILLTIAAARIVGSLPETVPNPYGRHKLASDPDCVVIVAKLSPRGAFLREAEQVLTREAAARGCQAATVRYLDIDVRTELRQLSVTMHCQSI